MLPHRFQYHRPTTLEQAFALLDAYGDDAAFYAGGTELLLALKARVLRYDHLVDLKSISGLKGVRCVDGEIVIGALSTHYALANDTVLQRLLPAYAVLSNGIANIRVRVAGTIGGNLCFAEPHADPPPFLAAAGAVVVLRSAAGERRLAVAEFIEGEFTTQRAPDEILTEIRIPLPSPETRFSYQSFGHLERPAVGVAAVYAIEEGAPKYRLWVGAIGDHPINLISVEEAIAGVPPENLDDVLPGAALAAAETLPAHDDLQGSAEYKQHLASVLIRRALAQATGRPAQKEALHGAA